MADLTNHQKGFLRDKEILQFLTQVKVCTNEQIQCLFYPANTDRTVRQKMESLSNPKRELVKRDRASKFHPWFYWPYEIPKPKQIEHSLGVTWMYIWRTATMGQWQKLYYYKKEIEYGKKLLRVDGLMGFENNMDKTRPFDWEFHEYDRAESGNDFDKVLKYNTFFSLGAYKQLWWADKAHRFPKIYVVTTGKKDKILRRIDEENTNDLEFKVYTEAEMREEVEKWRVLQFLRKKSSPQASPER